MKMEHTFREGNQLADLFTNLMFDFAVSTNFLFNSIHKVPETVRKIIILEKIKNPYLRIKKL